MNSTKNETSPDVAALIARQLGGWRRVSAMIGVYDALNHGDALSFKFRGSRAATFCKITLRGDDTYDVKFGKIRKYELIKVQDFEMVQSAQLAPLFERVTGLRLSLGTMGR